MGRVINSFVFQEQQENLISVANAIQHLGLQVLNMHNDLPDEIRERMEPQVTAIESMCHCLGVVAYEGAANAETWTRWATKEDFNIVYRG